MEVIIPGGKGGERENKRRPYFVDETEKGRMPGQKGRGAGIALRSRCGGEE